VEILPWRGGQKKYRGAGTASLPGGASKAGALRLAPPAKPKKAPGGPHLGVGGWPSQRFSQRGPAAEAKRKYNAQAGKSSLWRGECGRRRGRVDFRRLRPHLTGLFCSGRTLSASRLSAAAGFPLGKSVGPQAKKDRCVGGRGAGWHKRGLGPRRSISTGFFGKPPRDSDRGGETKRKTA